MTTRSRVRSFGFALLAVFAVAFFAQPALAQQSSRAVVLGFEGWHADQARRAASRRLGERVVLVAEDQLIETAAQIAADVSSPEGLSRVIEHLGVTLLVGGSVEGSGRRSSTTIWVMDTAGNELARETTVGPTSRAAQGTIADAALAAVDAAISAIYRAARESEPDPAPADPVERDEPGWGHSMLREREGPARWEQPLVRILGGVRIRDRGAYVHSPSGTDFYESSFFPDIQLMAEIRPLARAEGAERGLFFAVSGGFSAGIRYFRGDGAERDLLTYGFGIDAGYGFVIAEMVELVLSAGFGLDGFDLSDGLDIDFPSTLYTFVRPALQGRIRLVPEDLLVLEAGVGGRIAFDAGAIQRFGPDGTSAFGVDFFAGLAGTIEPGFSWAARFAYQSYFLGFSGIPDTTSGTDAAIQILLMVGWSF